MKTNLLKVLPKLTIEDREDIALAYRRYDPKHGLKTNFPHYLEAAKATDRIGMLDFDKVMAALREAAPLYPEVRRTIRKLERFERRGHFNQPYLEIF
jgi:site-specific DNA-adenine methylase